MLSTISNVKNLNLIKSWQQCFIEDMDSAMIQLETAVSDKQILSIFLRYGFDFSKIPETI